MIFVQIPSYRDSELPITLDQLISKASHPNRLRIAVAWQHGPKEKLPLKYSQKANVEILDIPHELSRGCNWARSLLQHRWEGEKHTLLIDSHHRFVSNWDDKLLEMHERLKKEGIRKPILTAYLPPYNSENGAERRVRSCFKIYFKARTYGVLTHLTSYEITGWRSLKKPVIADFLSLHFLFADGKFNREVLFDPDTYYTGDEASISLRAFTHGYDFFHPHCIMGWHEYNRKNRTPHWDDHPEWFRQDIDSLLKLESMYSGRMKGRMGIGAQRSLKEYERFIGMLLLRRESRSNTIV